MKVRDIIKILERNGWQEVTRKGSHRQLKNDNIPGRVTVAGHPNDDLGQGTLNSICKQAGLSKEDLR